MDYFEEIASRLMKWTDGERSGPYSLEFFVDKACNQKCRFCDSNKSNKSLDFNAAFKILREANKLDVKRCSVVGLGEPFFKKNKMIKLMEKIKQYDMFGNILTNGTLLDEKIVKKLIEIEWDEIEFSIHGPDAATHDYLVRLPGAFDKVVHNIRRFNYWKQKLKKDKPRLRTCFTLNKVNYNKIEDMIRLCEKLKCSFLLRPLEIENEDDDQMKILVLNDNEKNIAKEKMKKIKIFKKTKIEISLPHKDGKFVTEIFNNKMKSEEKKSIEPDNFINSMCFEPWFNITIRDYRYFGACCRSIYSNLNKKNERKYKSLKDIWFGEYFEKMRKNSIKREFKDFCSACCNDFVNDDTVCISKKLKTMINQKK